MYQEEIKTLYLNKGKIRIFLKPGVMLNWNKEVGQVCFPMHGGDSLSPIPRSMESQHLPDYHVPGTYKKSKLGSVSTAVPIPTFTIRNREKAEHVLYITGIPNGQDLSPFRITGDVIYSSFWQDKNKDMGYLFQVVTLKTK